MRALKLILIAAGLMVPACSGQSLLDQVNFANGPQAGGIHLLGASVFSGYSTSAYPQAAANLYTVLGPNLGGDGSYGATFGLGWQGRGQNGDLSVLYTGTYSGQIRYSNLNGYSQTLAISAAYRLGPNWTFTLAGNGGVMNLSEYMYQPSPQSVITQVPANFDDLAAAVGAGQYTNTEVAALLTGSPILQSPARALLMADRVLSYSAQAGLTYRASDRLTFHFAGFAAAGQSLLSGQENSPAPVSYIMPRTLSANGGVSFSYSLSPTTTLNAEVDVIRTLNHFDNLYDMAATAGIGRKIGERWFLNIHAGGNYNIVTEQVAGSPAERQIIGGASLGFRAGAHTFLTSYQRSGTDGYAFAVGTFSSTSGSWSWRPPGTRLGVTASFGDVQTRNAGFVSLSGWEGAGGLFFSLNPHMSMTAQYVYMNDVGTYLGTYARMAVQSVRLTFGWAPRSLQQH
jgi:hypothetical protein